MKNFFLLLVIPLGVFAKQVEPDKLFPNKKEPEQTTQPQKDDNRAPSAARNPFNVWSKEDLLVVEALRQKDALMRDAQRASAAQRYYLGYLNQMKNFFQNKAGSYIIRELDRPLRNAGFLGDAGSRSEKCFFWPPSSSEWIIEDVPADEQILDSPDFWLKAPVNWVSKMRWRIDAVCSLRVNTKACSMGRFAKIVADRIKSWQKISTQLETETQVEDDIKVKQQLNQWIVLDEVLEALGKIDDIVLSESIDEADDFDNWPDVTTPCYSVNIVDERYWDPWNITHPTPTGSDPFGVTWQYRDL